VFNLQPGQGLGFPGSKQIALGLGTPFTVIVIIVPVEQAVSVPGGGIGPGAERRFREEREVREIMLIIVKAGILN
jgi:hypothetical protein